LGWWYRGRIEDVPEEMKKRADAMVSAVAK
jgi:hypothetical protein